jgi:transposase InsO family protein
MGSVGDAYDNAMCESFFATLETELLDRRRFRTRPEARIAVFESSKAGTTRTGAILASGMIHPSTTNGGAVPLPEISSPYPSTEAGQLHDYYLDEFTFRFDRRSAAHRGLLFHRLLEQAVQTEHTTTDQLFLGVGRGPQRQRY